MSDGVAAVARRGAALSGLICGRHILAVVGVGCFGAHLAGVGVDVALRAVVVQGGAVGAGTVVRLDVGAILAEMALNIGVGKR